VNAGAYKCADQRQWIYLPATRYAPTAEYLSQLLECGDHRSVHALERDIRAWITAWNEIPKPFVWANTAEQILESIGTINETNQRRGTLARIAAAGKCCPRQR
jgi:hypothetical protein